MAPADNKNKVPPHNEEAERATLGALLNDPSDREPIVTAIQYLRGGDFYSAANGRIYETILDLYDRNLAADVLTVINELRQAGRLDESGGAAYVSSLLNEVPSSVNVEYYAQTVQDYSLRRALLRVSSYMVSDAYDESKESRFVLEETQKRIFELGDTRQTFTLRSAEDIIKDTVKDIERVHRSQRDISGIPSGFDELDRMTFGFQSQELIIIGARPSMGKTALALTMASHISITKQIPTAFFTLEMSDKALMLRILSGETRINSNSLRTGFIKSSDYDNIWQAMDKISKAPLYIVDMPNMKLLDLRTQARRLRAQQKVGIIFIDYLGLITLETGRFQQRHEQISEISRSLKSLARELKIPIVVCSQLTREAEKEKPNLASIRDSGAIEQDADVVMFLHRDRDSDKTPDEQKQEEKIGKKTNLILSKQRNGPTGTIELLFEAPFTRFVSYAGDRYENR